MAKPTDKQIHELHRALYKRKRLKKLSDLVQETALLMNLDPTQELPPDDVRNPPGSGPQWFYPDTGAVDSNVLAAAQNCSEISKTLRAIRSDVADVSFPEADKKHVLAALDAEAASWSARGKAWGAAGPPADVEATVATVSKHVSTSLAEAKQVRHYLLSKQELGLG